MRPTDKTHRQIAFAFDAEYGTFAGTSGCNELDGYFQADAAKMTLKSAKPLRICRVDQRTERALRGVINDTRGYRILGKALELLDEKGQRIAKFER